MNGTLQREDVAKEAVRKIFTICNLCFADLDKSIHENNGTIDSIKVGMAFNRLGQTGDELIKKARLGDKDATFAIDNFAAAAVGGGAKLPKSLAKYVIDKVMGRIDTPKKPGRASFNNDRRDFAIIVSVTTLNSVYGFAISRGMRGGSETACSIVSEVLEEFGTHLAEDSVYRIWSAGKGAFPSLKIR